jgi:iron complex outermembrane receptor protein
MHKKIFRFLSTTALVAIGVTSFAAISLAQSAATSGTTLPSVTVDAPAARRAPAATTRPRATQAGGTRRAASRRAAAPPAPTIAAASAIERADGPVSGNVATRSATGAKTNAAIIEIPQTVNVVTADQIRSQGALSISEALRYTPGVTVEPYGASGLYDVFTLVRGFRADLYLDGSRLPKGVVDGIASTVVDPWMLERVEVLKGPASGLYGAGSPGGIINMVSKQPSAEPIREVEIQGGSFGRVQGAFDLGGPIDAQKQFLYRITGVVGHADAQTDFANNDYYWVSPSFTWRPDMDTKLTISGHYKHDEGVWSFFNYLPAEGTITPLNGRKISTDLYTGEPSFDRRKFDQGWVGYQFEKRLNDTVVLSQNLRYGVSDLNMRAAATGRFPADADGNLTRLPIDLSTSTKTFTIDNRANLNFGIGPFQHDVAVGIDYLREEVDYKFKASFDTTTLNAFAPVYGQAIGTPDVFLSNFASTLDQVGIYAQDRIRLGGWLLTLGGRFDSASSEVRDRGDGTTTPVKSAQDDTAFTGRAGLTYLFDNGVAPYVSYATSFQPETGIDGVTLQPFKPSTGQQIEGGIKYQPPGTKTLLTAAVFDLTQQNRLTSTPDFLQRQIGEVNVRGVEFEAKTEFAHNLDLIASYAYLETEITQSANPAEVGFRLSTIPAHQAAVWTNYLFDNGALAGLSLGGGVRYNGESTDTANVVSVPAFTLVDARIGYDFGYRSPALNGVKLALNATNLFDKTYVSQCDGDLMCTYGSRRRLLATLSYRW